MLFWSNLASSGGFFGHFLNWWLRWRVYAVATSNGKVSSGTGLITLARFMAARYCNYPSTLLKPCTTREILLWMSLRWLFWRYDKIIWTSHHHFTRSWFAVCKMFAKKANRKGVLCYTGHTLYRLKHEKLLRRSLYCSKYGAQKPVCNLGCSFRCIYHWMNNHRDDLDAEEQSDEAEHNQAGEQVLLAHSTRPFSYKET